MLIDVVTLAMLYSLRVIGGAAATSVPASEWLIGFSMFIFASARAESNATSKLATRSTGICRPIEPQLSPQRHQIVAALAARIRLQRGHGVRGLSRPTQ